MRSWCTSLMLLVIMAVAGCGGPSGTYSGTLLETVTCPPSSGVASSQSSTFESITLSGVTVSTQDCTNVPAVTSGPKINLSPGFPCASTTVSMQGVTFKQIIALSSGTLIVDGNALAVDLDESWTVQPVEPAGTSFACDHVSIGNLLGR